MQSIKKKTDQISTIEKCYDFKSFNIIMIRGVVCGRLRLCVVG